MIDEWKGGGICGFGVFGDKAHRPPCTMDWTSNFRIGRIRSRILLVIFLFPGLPSPNKERGVLSDLSCSLSRFPVSASCRLPTASPPRVLREKTRQLPSLMSWRETGAGPLLSPLFHHSVQCRYECVRAVRACGAGSCHFRHCMSDCVVLLRVLQAGPGWAHGLTVRHTCMADGL